jgi:hypothetical protein
MAFLGRHLVIDFAGRRVLAVNRRSADPAGAEAALLV